MRTLVAIFLIIGLCYTNTLVSSNPVPSSRGLHDDLNDFIALVPAEEVMKIALEYMEKDPEVQFVVEYFQSAEFRELVRDVEAIPDVINFYNYLEESGLKVYDAVNKLHDLIGLPPLESLRLLRSSYSKAITGGVAGLIADIKSVLPIDDIKALYREKLTSSPEFKQLVDRLNSPKFQHVVDSLVANEEFQMIISAAKEYGVDVKAVADLLSTMFGLEFGPHKHVRVARALHDDLNDFIALVPTEQVMAIALEYMEKDPEVQFVVEYFQSAEFRELVKAVEAIPDVINFYNYLEESGLKVHDAVNKLHDLIGLPPLQSLRLLRSSSSRAITGGVAGLIADIKSVLPIDDIKALYREKLTSSPEFKQLVDRLNSPKFQYVVDSLIANEEFQMIISAAKEYGVDVKAVADLLSTMFGLEFGPHKHVRIARALHDDLDDFMALLPTEKIIEVILEYFENDEEVKFVMKYIETEDFHKLVILIEANPDVINFYDYLEESGLKVYDYIDKWHQLIGLPSVNPAHSSRLARSRKITGGVAGLIADVKMLLPIEDIKALYVEKLQTSVHFKLLIERLQSPKFQALVDALLVNEEFQFIIKTAKEFGVDVKAFAELLSTLFGLEFPFNYHSSKFSALNRESHYVDFADFIHAVDVDKIQSVIDRYMKYDPEFRAVMNYVTSEEFKGLHQNIHQLKSVRNFFVYLDQSGLNWQETMNQALEHFGHSNGIPGHPTPFDARPPTNGMDGFMDEILFSLPHGRWYELFEEKMANDEHFVNFVQRVMADDFKHIVEAVVRDVEFKSVVNQMENGGLKVQPIIDFVCETLGIEQYHNALSRQRSNEDLHKDFEDFIMLLPLPKMMEIGLHYLSNDAEVQEAVAFLKSEELQVLAAKLQQDKDVYEVLKYIEESGADVIDGINFLNELLGIPPYPTGGHGRFRRSETTGIHGMLNAIREVLPHDKIKDMYNHKVEHSESFKYFVQRLSSPELQAIVDKIVVNENVLALAEQAFNHGMDINKIGDFLFELFGLKFPGFPPSFRIKYALLH